jgi:hypothetical protein
MKSRRTLIEEVISSINMEAKKKTIKLTLKLLWNYFLLKKTLTIDQIPRSSRYRQGRPEERDQWTEEAEFQLPTR